MLRITQTVHASGAPVIKLEGKLLAPWIDQVRALCVHSTVAGMPMLDLSALTFADQAGTQLLQGLQQLLILLFDFSVRTIRSTGL